MIQDICLPGKECYLKMKKTFAYAMSVLFITKLKYILILSK